MARKKRRKLPRNCRKVLARCQVGKHGKLRKCRRVGRRKK